jgi:iron complex transport system substrate-binding protein
VTLSNDPADQNVHERNLRIVGALLGRTSRVEQIIGLQRATLRKVRDAVSAVPAGTRPRVLYLRLAEQSFAPAGTPTYQNFWIGLAGGTNVASNMRGNASTVSAEQIVAWNPDVILLGSFDGATPETIAGDRRLAGVAAVRNRRVYKMPHGGYRWDPGSLESHLAWQWVAQLLRGDRLGLDLRRSMRETFALLYRHTITDSEIDRVLQMRLNDGQAGYGIFRAP